MSFYFFMLMGGVKILFCSRPPSLAFFFLACLPSPILSQSCISRFDRGSARPMQHFFEPPTLDLRAARAFFRPPPDCGFIHTRSPKHPTASRIVHRAHRRYDSDTWFTFFFLFLFDWLTSFDFFSLSRVFCSSRLLSPPRLFRRLNGLEFSSNLTFVFFFLNPGSSVSPSREFPH